MTSRKGRGLGWAQSYRARLRRKRFLVRAFLRRRQLTLRQDHTARIAPNDILLFATARNERIRLPYFFQYYRGLGVNHFLFVDNDSTDGTLDFLLEQPDASIWHTSASYRSSRFGMDWINHLLRQYGGGHWTLVVDPDEFFVYPFCDTRPLQALTDWLDSSQIRSFGAMLLDMYPKGPLDAQPYVEGTDPFEIASWFDSGNYTLSRNHFYGNLWIQGGPRARMFFADDPWSAPSLNKIPLVRWQRHYAYASSTHSLLPRGLNLTYDEGGGEKASGCLMHAKFLHTLNEKATEELQRGQHYAGSREYKAYARQLKDSPDLWCKWSEKFINWRQLEILGLISKGNWA